MKIPIIATSLVKFGDLWNKGINDLVKEIGQKALKDANTGSSDVDSIYIANEFSSIINGMSSLNSVVFEELGIDNGICVNTGDASGAAAIKEAAASILSGQNEITMVLGVEKLTDLKTDEVLSLSSNFISQEESFVGATVHSQFAIMTKKYISDFHLSPNDLSFIPSSNHKNAINNEYAQYRFELAEEKINASQLFADPIRMFDLASYCDGAAALIMCSEEIAAKFSKKIKGYLLASSIASDSLSLSRRNSITAIESTIKASEMVFKESRINASDIDLMEIYDIAPISEILAVEDIGFAKKGHGPDFIRKNLGKINLSGGLKACGHAIGPTGIRQAVDLLSRLRIRKLKYGLTQTLSGTGSCSIVNIFSRD